MAYGLHNTGEMISDMVFMTIHLKCNEEHIMIKRTFISILSLLLALMFISVAMAEEPGNKRKGKYTYRKVYKACFERGAVDSHTPPISPSDKTMAQWAQVFDSKDFAQFGCEQEWTKLSEKDVLDIYSYLHAHGSDSPTPAKCK